MVAPPGCTLSRWGVFSVNDHPSLSRMESPTTILPPPHVCNGDCPPPHCHTHCSPCAPGPTFPSGCSHQCTTIRSDGSGGTDTVECVARVLSSDMQRTVYRWWLRQLSVMYAHIRNESLHRLPRQPGPFSILLRLTQGSAPRVLLHNFCGSEQRHSRISYCEKISTL